MALTILVVYIGEKDKDLDKIVEGNFMFIFIVRWENKPKCKWHDYRSIYLNRDLFKKKWPYNFQNCCKCCENWSI